MEIFAPEDPEVKAICERIGYGAVMDSAARQWAEKSPEGALTVGPCAGMKAPELEKAEALADDLENQIAELQAGMDQAEARAAEMERVLEGTLAVREMLHGIKNNKILPDYFRHQIPKEIRECSDVLSNDGSAFAEVVRAERRLSKAVRAVRFSGGNHWSPPYFMVIKATSGPEAEEFLHALADYKIALDALDGSG